MLPCDGAPVLEKVFEKQYLPQTPYVVQVRFEHDTQCHGTHLEIEFESRTPPEIRTTVRGFER